MSGDKLLGGPQAGLILGGSRWIAAMRQNPLVRAFRVDRATLAALEATLALYREPERARREIPALRMLSTPASDLRARAERAHAELVARGIPAAIVESSGAVGAGAFPTAELPGYALALEGDAEQWSARLRGGDPAVVGRVKDGRLLLDVRTVPEDSIDLLVNAVVLANG
jgi:L-seryl-tRNA(Ser) seleniumtransferase